MEVTLERLFSNSDATLGVLFLNSVSACFILEDEFRTKKVWGETRIPSGRYALHLRDVGESPHFDQSYNQRFGALHQGMIEICDVPNFTSILLHVGCTDKDTAGCLLTGYEAARLPQTSTYILGHSGDAYIVVYPPIRDALKAGEECWLTIIDRDR